MFFRNLKNNKGQAIFEMVIFLPFLVFLFTIFYTVGNSLSGSINQQKAVRGYYYHLVKGNSYIVPPQDIEGYKAGGIKKMGFFAIGWSETQPDGQTPSGNCFHFTSMLKNGSTEECISKTRDPADESSFVRIFTMYGVCGPVFQVTDNGQVIIEQHAQMEQCALL